MSCRLKILGKAVRLFLWSPKSEKNILLSSHRVSASWLFHAAHAAHRTVHSSTHTLCCISIALLRRLCCLVHALTALASGCGTEEALPDSKCLISRMPLNISQQIIISTMMMKIAFVLATLVLAEAKIPQVLFTDPFATA
jgi:hypothetical protein